MIEPPHTSDWPEAISDGLAEAMVQIQWTGTGHTVILMPTRWLVYEPRVNAAGLSSSEVRTFANPFPQGTTLYLLWSQMWIAARPWIDWYDRYEWQQSEM